MGVSFNTLEQWLAWQEQLHPRAIVLGLERVQHVYRALGSPTIARHVVTVAGTNGKGSCVALLDSLYRHAGYRVGAYTSPHLLRYNERISIGGQPVSDAALISAFERIEAARGGRTLTYFEFGTLAALVLLAEAELDLALLEVGMGGRLDATNLIDADVAVITSVGLDHQEWLGETREAIAREKAGIARPGKPLVCGDRSLAGLWADAAPGAVLYRLGDEFDYAGQAADGDWTWRTAGGTTLEGLPPTSTQPDNAAATIQVAELLREAMPYRRSDLESALRDFALPGRRQNIGSAPEVWLDVAHNREAIDALVAVLQRDRRRPAELVFGALEGKPIRAMVEALAPLAAHWHIAAPDCPRALAVAEVETVLREQTQPVTSYTGVNEAFAAARRSAGPEGCVVVTGSFYTVAEVMARDGQYVGAPGR